MTSVDQLADNLAGMSVFNSDELYNMKEELEHHDAKDEGLMAFLKRLLSFKGDFDSIGMTAPLSIQEPATRIDMLGRMDVTEFAKLGELKTPEDRLIGVFKFLCAQLGVGASCKKKPLNSLIFECNLSGFAPAKGEEKVFKCKFAQGVNTDNQYDVDGQLPITLMGEQISHHPPIAACSLQSKDATFFLVDHFAGKLSATALMLVQKGYSYLTIHTFNETYTIQMADAIVIPRGGFFSGIADMVWTGESIIRCEQTGMETVLTFPKKKLFASPSYDVKGGLRKIGSKSWLYEFSGNWEKDIYMQKVGSKDKTVVCSSVREPQWVQVLPPHLPPNHYVKLWTPIYEQMKLGKFDEGTKIKTGLENRQREYFRSIKGKQHHPKYFEKDAAGEWKLKEQYLYRK